MLKGTELVEIIAEANEITKKEAKIELDRVVEGIATAIEKGGVRVSGLGTFEVVERAARTCRNPQTGEMMEVSAKKAPKFKAAKSLKDSVAAQ